MDEYRSAKKMEERIESELAPSGYRVNRYRDECALEIGYGEPKPKTISEYDAETARIESALGYLKRTYTLKLFAGGAETEELFASLANELSAVIG